MARTCCELKLYIYPLNISPQNLEPNIFCINGVKITYRSGNGVSRIAIIIILVVIGIAIGGLYVWITFFQQNEDNLQSIELSLEPPAARIDENHYTIYVQQSAPLGVIGTFSNGSTFDVSTHLELIYCFSPCEELNLDETNKRVTGLLVSENAIPLHVKINDVTSNTIYIKVVLPTY